MRPQFLVEFLKALLPALTQQGQKQNLLHPSPQALHRNGVTLQSDNSTPKLTSSMLQSHQRGKKRTKKERGKQKSSSIIMLVLWTDINPTHREQQLVFLFEKNNSVFHVLIHAKGKKDKTSNYQMFINMTKEI